MAGEADAGKSTLWRAAVRAAAGAGCQILRSEPAASEADLSFAGLSDLLPAVLPEVASALPAPQWDALEVALLLKPGGEAGPPTAHAIGLGVLATVRAALASCCSWPEKSAGRWNTCRRWTPTRWRLRTWNGPYRCCST